MKKNKEIEKFGIMFGDNDFYNVFRNMLPLIAENLYSDKRVPVTKKHIAKIISASAYGFYRACQNQFQYNDDEDEEHIHKYLSVTERQVYIDKELDDLIAKKDGWCNSELYCVLLPTEYTPVYFWVI